MGTKTGVAKVAKISPPMTGAMGIIPKTIALFIWSYRFCPSRYHFPRDYLIICAVCVIVTGCWDAHEPIPPVVLPLLVPPAPPIHLPGDPPRGPLPETLPSIEWLAPPSVSVVQPVAKSVIPATIKMATLQNVLMLPFSLLLEPPMETSLCCVQLSGLAPFRWHGP